jgi:hypothetical protein
MARSPKLNDIHLILLSTAFARDAGSVLPVADSIVGKADDVTKALTHLLKHKLIEEIPAGPKEPVWREARDDRFGLTITDAGKTAIDAGGDKEPGPVPPPPAQPQRQTKSAAVVALLQREEGATLAELVEATGWLPHTTRAALTGLRKKGHVIDKGKRGDMTCYRITKA